ncbi:H-NS family nucleoid-associated regulatory protein [Bradyrhizobium manausense]|uniref:H-NS histone family protein n=1 Tax=Bradyrhizobium manausense TaxID=989370 RepID=UPI0009FB92D4|nr:H-NS histone family protein [Bradyrhizobium manausense]
MTSDDFGSMCTDDLWILYQEITDVLAEKIVAKKAALELRLCELDTAERMRGVRKRRSYPPVFAKYHNPDNLVQSWSGRGKTPLWLKAQLMAGNRLEDFLIDRPRGEGRRRSG